MEERKNATSFILTFLNVILLSLLTFFVSSDNGEFSFVFFAAVTLYLVAASTSKKISYYSLFAAPFLSYAALVLLKGDPVFSLTVFLPYIFPTALLEFVIKRKISRGAVLTVSSIATTALLTAAFLYAANGFTSAPVEAVRQYYTETVDIITQALNRNFVISIAGKEASLLSSDYIDALIDSIIELAPAFIFFLLYSAGFICSALMYQPIYEKADDDIFERWIIKSEPPAFISIILLTVFSVFVTDTVVYVALLTTDVIIWTGILFDGTSSSFRKRLFPGGILRRPFVRPVVLVLLGLISPVTVPVTAAVYAAKDCLSRYAVKNKPEDGEEEDRT